MVSSTFKKKIIGKTIQTGSNQSSSLTDTPLQSEAIASAPVSQTYLPIQGDRGRVMIFIDGANLFYAASYLKIEIDYVKLRHYLAAQDCLVHIFFYTGYDPADEKQYRFLHWMRRNGFRVIAKAVTQAPDGAKKANLDVEIAVDMMRLAQHCDTAVLVSGDGDFVYVVDAIAGQGVRVEVIGLRSMTSNSLIDVANCYVDLAGIQHTVQKRDIHSHQQTNSLVPQALPGNVDPAVPPLQRSGRAATRHSQPGG